MVMTAKRKATALVTGAGRGIGRAIALALADEGFNLVLNDIPSSSDLAETVALVEKRGAVARPVPADISTVETLDSFVEAAWSAFGELTCLVNNAGISVAERDDILKVTPESYDRLMAVNLRGPFFLTQAIARRMIGERTDAFRSVISISSINVTFASIDRAEYCISKSGLAMMSELYAIRLAEEGVNVYEVRPGVIRTQMTAVARERYDRLFAGGLAPIARWGEPEDVGGAVAMLASGRLRYSTGEVINVDGGIGVRRL
jgi:3-oxoacyl-[acyl-carrier protein] reductase